MTVVTDFMIWLLAAYGCSTLLLKMGYILLNRETTLITVTEPMTHYQLLVYNSEHRLEAVVRKLMFQSGLYGRSIQISIVDDGSSDDTVKMKEILHRVHESTLTEEQDGLEHVVIIDLRTLQREAG
ncbi:hypothetical protein [Brevibacillus daliensis]|uniref:hypothetical protein n=1 Tax=Brevibacillus daliensis TaxID=2892995 RepID=UPI001E51A44E|nr:hypothetical protein [Brevibacillus daliensis]